MNILETTGNKIELSSPLDFDIDKNTKLYLAGTKNVYKSQTHVINLSLFSKQCIIESQNIHFHGEAKLQSWSYKISKLSNQIYINHNYDAEKANWLINIIASLTNSI